jgi:hypothetical protein
VDMYEVVRLVLGRERQRENNDEIHTSKNPPMPVQSE